jgi:peptidoglycan/xylan/chitin deacetylase (PgdA/CDA1 family)
MYDQRAGLPLILMYHSVCDHSTDPYRVTVSPHRFAEHMRWLRLSGMQAVSVRELLDAPERTAGGRRLVGLTFDDGYADFSTVALPILRRFGFTATVFVVADRLGGHNDWDPAGPTKALMTADQVRAAAGMGIEIGSHGMSHTSLAAADPVLLKSEVESSRDVLESLLGTSVGGFCYPYGELSDATVSAVRDAGYDYGVATWHRARKDRHALPRTYVGERDRSARLRAKQLRHRLVWGGRRWS